MKPFSILASVAASVLTLATTFASAQDIAVLTQARDILPERIREAGILQVATSYQWAPFGFVKEDGEPDGIDLQMMELLAAKLGLTAEFTDLKFPSIVPGVETGRFDAGVNQMGITAERGKVVDFVPYFNSAYGLLVPSDRPEADINHLCGKTLALTQGSSQIAIAEELSAKCVAAGEEEIAMDFYPNSADTYLAIANGRGDGFLTARAVGVYTASMNTKLSMTDGVLAVRRSISGIVVNKAEPEVKEALTLAMISAVEDGSFMSILEGFGVPEGILTAEEIMAAPSF